MKKLILLTGLVHLRLELRIRRPAISALMRLTTRRLSSRTAAAAAAAPLTIRPPHKSRSPSRE